MVQLCLQGLGKLAEEAGNAAVLAFEGEEGKDKVALLVVLFR